MPEMQNPAVTSKLPEAMNDPILQELYRYWTALQRSDDLPSRSDLDPVDIPRLLPYILLVECHEAERRIKFRLVGTDVAFGSDPTGKFLQDAAPVGAYGTHITGLYRFAANSDTALYSEYSYGYTADRGPRLIKRLFLPLIGTAEIPRMMLVGQTRDKSLLVTQSAWQAGPGKIEERALFAVRPIPESSSEAMDAEAPNKESRPQSVPLQARA